MTPADLTRQETREARHKPTLAEAVSAFIALARDKHGLGRFTPDELPLLNEMARLAQSEMDDLAAHEHAQARRTTLEKDRLARKHVVQRGTIGFTYKLTPPSGPAPASGVPSSGEDT